MKNDQKSLLTRRDFIKMAGYAALTTGVGAGLSEMEEYGFSDYFGFGDIIAHTEGGYLHDDAIAAMS